MSSWKYLWNTLVAFLWHDRAVSKLVSRYRGKAVLYICTVLPWTSLGAAESRISSMIWRLPKLSVAALWE